MKSKAMPPISGCNCSTTLSAFLPWHLVDWGEEFCSFPLLIVIFLTFFDVWLSSFYPLSPAWPAAWPFPMIKDSLQIICSLLTGDEREKIWDSQYKWRIPVNRLAMREQIKIPNNQSRMARMFLIFFLSEWLVRNWYSWMNRHLMNLVHIGMQTCLAGRQTFIEHSFKHLHLFEKMSKYLNGFVFVKNVCCISILW